jgi:hypothetical protein
LAFTDYPLPPVLLCELCHLNLNIPFTPGMAVAAGAASIKFLSNLATGRSACPLLFRAARPVLIGFRGFPANIARE